MIWEYHYFRKHPHQSHFPIWIQIKKLLWLWDGPSTKVCRFGLQKVLLAVESRLLAGWTYGEMGCTIDWNGWNNQCWGRSCFTWPKKINPAISRPPHNGSIHIAAYSPNPVKGMWQHRYPNKYSPAWYHHTWGAKWTMEATAPLNPCDW